MRPLFNILLSQRRQTLGLKVKEISSVSGIDQSLISKFESGARLPSEKNLRDLSVAYSIDYDVLRTNWLAQRLIDVVKEEADPSSAWLLAEPRIEYLIEKGKVDTPIVSTELKRKLKIIDGLRVRWKSSHPLNQLQLEKMRSYFDVEYTFESNRIEGNTLTLHETMLVVEQGLTIGGKSVREHLEAINHAEAVVYMRELAGDRGILDRRELLSIHRLVLKGVDDQNAGSFRQVNVRITGSEHIPPEHFHIEQLMDDFFQAYKRNYTSVHPVILAADLHEKLVTIHPFVDGNGRTARLIMNLILLQNGYTICNLKGDSASRLRYYKALENCQVRNDASDFYALVADEMILSLESHLALV